MPAFQFPAAPFDLQTVENTITGSTYQWRPELTKWVLTRQQTKVSDIIWEGDNPPDPIGDYKLWYSTDTLELYFYYCDANGVCAWVPTSVPIQVLEDLNAFAAQAEVDIDQLQYKQQLLQNTLDQLYLDNQLDATDQDLDELRTQVNGNSYTNNQQTQSIIALEELIVALQEELNTLKDLTEPNQDLYSSIAYIPFTNDQTIYPLELIDKGAGWTGGGVTSQFMYDIADKPVHVGFRANQVTMPQFDIGLAIRLTHTSGVIYGKIKSAWHSGQVHLNLEDQAGDPFVAGEFVTEIALQDSKFVERAGDTMIGDLKFEGTNQVVTRHIDSGQNSNLELKHNGTTRIFVGGSAVSVNNSLIVKNANAEAEDLIFKVEGNQANDGTGDNVLYLQRKASGGDQLRYYGPVTFNKEVTTKEYVDSVIPFVPLPTSLQLGAFNYRRVSDGWSEGTIQSNTTTDPGQISQLKVHFKNKDAFNFGASFLQEAVREKMFITVYDGNNYYQGRITDVTADNKGVILNLNYIKSAGTFYYNNVYWVSISINKHDTPIQ